MHYPTTMDIAPGETGITKLLEQEHENMRKVAESMRIDQMGHEVKEIRYLIEEIDRRITLDVHKTTIIDSKPSRLSRLFSKIIRDPALEIFKIL